MKDGWRERKKIAYVVGLALALFVLPQTGWAASSTSSESILAQETPLVDQSGSIDSTQPPPTSTTGQEVIKDFASQITVNADGHLSVTETIQVYAANIEIRHGIYRDFPTSYQLKNGIRSTVGFHLEQVLQDGNPEPYHTQQLTNGVRIFIGDPDQYVSVGDHTYQLSYTTDRQLGFFDTYDELYWNVTGNGWSFPIQKASAIVTIPGNFTRDQLQGRLFTGAPGSQSQNGTAESNDQSTARFTTTSELAPGEGLTIDLLWPKGAVTAPTASQQQLWFWEDNAALPIAILGVLILFCLYLWTWFRVGRDPKKGTIIPQYEPPKGFSPAMVRHLERHTFDQVSFAATLTNLAVKGWLTIQEPTRGSYTIQRTGKNGRTLSSDEQVLLQKILPSNDSLELKPKDMKLRQLRAVLLQAAKLDASATVESAIEETYYHPNRTAIGYGFGLFVLLLLELNGVINSVSILWLFSFAVAFFGLLGYAIYRLRQPIQTSQLSPTSIEKHLKLTTTIITVTVVLFQIVARAGAAFSKNGQLPPSISLFFETMVNSMPVFLTVLIVAALTIVFWKLLPAYTPIGRQMLDELEGFKWFLTVTEKDRLNFAHPPNKTTALFEAFLPFAIGLGVENKWAGQFSQVFANLAAAGTPYVPAWYVGNSWTYGANGNLSSNFGAGLSSVISSASTTGGSGGSGGGGGGGGGGGW